MAFRPRGSSGVAPHSSSSSVSAVSSVDSAVSSSELLVPSGPAFSPGFDQLGVVSDSSGTPDSSPAGCSPPDPSAVVELDVGSISSHSYPSESSLDPGESSGESEPSDSSADSHVLESVSSHDSSGENGSPVGSSPGDPSSSSSVLNLGANSSQFVPSSSDLGVGDLAHLSDVVFTSADSHPPVGGLNVSDDILVGPSVPPLVDPSSSVSPNHSGSPLAPV